MIARLIRLLDKIEDSFLVLILTSMIVLAVAQIVFRNLMGEGIVWIDPLLRMLVLWVALAGAIVASRTDNHIRIDLFTKYLPQAWLAVIRRLVYSITVAICAIIAWHSARFVLSEYEYNSTAFASLPVWVAALIIPLGFGLIAFRYTLLFFHPHRQEAQPVTPDEDKAVTATADDDSPVKPQ